MKIIFNQIYETLSHIVQLHEESPAAIRNRMEKLKELINNLPGTQEICRCDRFKEATEQNYEIKKNEFKDRGESEVELIRYSLCAVEGIESYIYFCPWCGGAI